MGSALTFLLARGAKEVWTAPGPKVARLLGEGLPGALLLGEVEGFPPEGFHGRAALPELEGFEVRGRPVVLLAPTLSGSLLPGEGEVYLGNFRNAWAVLEGLRGKALTFRPALAEGPLLSAVVALGFLLRKLRPEAPPNLATALLKAFPDPQEALFQSPEGQALHREGRTEDLARASLIGVDPVLPRLAEVRPFPKETYGLREDRFAQRWTA